MRVCVCVCEYIYGKLYICLVKGLMDPKLYQFLSLKQPNKLLKDDKDFRIPLAAERNSTTSTSYHTRHLSDNAGTCSWM